MATTRHPGDVGIPSLRPDPDRPHADISTDRSEADAQRLINQVLLTGLALARARTTRAGSRDVRRLAAKLDRAVHGLQQAVWSANGWCTDAFDVLAEAHEAARVVLDAELAAAEDSETRAVPGSSTPTGRRPVALR